MDDAAADAQVTSRRAARRAIGRGALREIPLGVRPRLIAASFLMLFVELALIRWLGSNVLHLSYFSNFVLLGSFLGIGLGFLLSRGRRSVAFVSPLLLGGLVAYVLLQPVEVRRGGADVIFFTTIQESTGAPIWIVLPLVFVVVAAILAGPAEIVGRCFARMRPLDAYRLDLVGSLAGILAFTGLAFASAPPLVWGAIAAVIYLLLLAHSRTAIASCALLVLFLGLETFSADLRWSPYSKLEVTSYEDGHFLVRANGVPHQEIRAADERVRLEPIYAAPYALLRKERPGNVLVIGEPATAATSRSRFAAVRRAWTPLRSTPG